MILTHRTIVPRIKKEQCPWCMAKYPQEVADPAYRQTSISRYYACVRCGAEWDVLYTINTAHITKKGKHALPVP